MGRNGKRRLRRARIELVTPAPAADEAAAITAAVERFLADTAPPASGGGQQVSAWQRAALREGVGARAGFGSAWGEPGESV